MLPDVFHALPGYGADVQKSRKQARIYHAEAWLRPCQPASAGTFDAFKIEASSITWGARQPANEEYFYSPVGCNYQYDFDDFNEHFELLSYTKSNGNAK